MQVLLVEPGKKAREAEIEDELHILQKIVGGSIEATYPWEDPVAVVCNEEGKINGLPLNRSLEDYDIIAGTFLICGLSEEDFDSLSPELMMKYKEKFLYPEMFLQIGGHIRSFKVRD